MAYVSCITCKEDFVSSGNNICNLCKDNPKREKSTLTTLRTCSHCNKNFSVNPELSHNFCNDCFSQMPVRFCKICTKRFKSFINWKTCKNCSNLGFR